MSGASQTTMPITSLRGRYGIGCFSAEAFAYVDRLKEAGQSCWQLLPDHTAGEEASLYRTFSAFAGEPYFIDLEELIGEGLLTREECDSMDFENCEEDVDREDQYRSRYVLLTMAYERSDVSQQPEYQRFVEENRWWLEDYALFMALKHFFGGRCWRDWPKDIRLRRGAAMEHYRKELHFDIEFQMVLQFWFFRQYRRLKNYASGKQIRIIGKLPAQTAGDSADTWAHPESFAPGW